MTSHLACWCTLKDNLLLSASYKHRTRRNDDCVYECSHAVSLFTSGKGDTTSVKESYEKDTENDNFWQRQQLRDQVQPASVPYVCEERVVYLRASIVQGVWIDTPSSQVILYLFIYLLQTTVGPYTNRRLKTHITINPERKKRNRPIQ